MNLQPLADDLADRHARAQAAIRVLKHHLQLAAQRANLLLAKPVQALAVTLDQALAVDQPQDRHAQCGLARAAFTDNAQGLPAGQTEADVGNRLDVINGTSQYAFFDRKPHPHLLRPQNIVCIRIDRHRLTAGVGSQQLTGVIVLRLAEQSSAIVLFDDVTSIHDTYPVGNFADQVQIVADQQHRHAEFLLQFLEQFEDFQLYRDIQCGGRLVGDQQLRFIGQGHGDHHTLALAAGQFMGIGAQALARLRNAHQLQQLQRAFTRLRLVQPLVQGEHFSNLPLHAVQWIERAHGLLKDHGYAVAADLAQLVFASLEQVIAVKLDAAAGV